MRSSSSCASSTASNELHVPEPTKRERCSAERGGLLVDGGAQQRGAEHVGVDAVPQGRPAAAARHQQIGVAGRPPSARMWRRLRSRAKATPSRHARTRSAVPVPSSRPVRRAAHAAAALERRAARERRHEDRPARAAGAAVGAVDELADVAARREQVAQPRQSRPAAEGRQRADVQAGNGMAEDVGAGDDVDHRRAGGHRHPARRSERRVEATLPRSAGTERHRRVVDRAGVHGDPRGKVERLGGLRAERADDLGRLARERRTASGRCPSRRGPRRRTYRW